MAFEISTAQPVLGTRQRRRTVNLLGDEQESPIDAGDISFDISTAQPVLQDMQISESLQVEAPDESLIQSRGQFDLSRASPDIQTGLDDPTSGLSALDAFTISAGRGLKKTGRGVQTLFNLAQQGLQVGEGGQAEDLARIEAERQEEARLFEPLEREFPIATTAGELTGEIGATLPIGLGVGSLATRAIAPAANIARSGGALRTAATAERFAPAIAAGTAEGSVIGAEEGDIATGAFKLWSRSNSIFSSYKSLLFWYSSTK